MEVTQEVLDNQFSVYLDKLSKGEYSFPPLLIIDDIVRKRYPEERIDIIDNAVEGFNIISIEDLKKYEVFNKIISYEDNDIYNPNLIDYYYSSNIVSKTIIIHYPEVIIKNSNNKSHTIKDLYLRTTFNNKGKLTEQFEMNRSTYTKAELEFGYRHSHHPNISINALSIREWNTTCLGEGPLSTQIGVLIYSNIDFSEGDIISYFCNLDSYITWESLEGVPYKRLEQIGTRGNTLKTLSDMSPRNDGDTIIKTFLKDHKLTNYFTIIASLESSTPIYKLIVKEKELVIDFSKYVSQDLSTNYLMLEDDFGNIKYMSPNSTYYSRTFSELNGITLFNFKGLPVRLNIIDIDNTIENQVTVWGLPEVNFMINNFKEYVNTQFSKTKFYESNL